MPQRKDFDPMDKREKRDIKERLCHALDIQPDVFFGEGLVEIRGRNSVTVRGGGKMLTYTDAVIRIQVGKGVLKIEGRRLCCTAYHVGAAVIDGRIDTVTFEEEV